MKIQETRRRIATLMAQGRVDDARSLKARLDDWMDRRGPQRLGGLVTNWTESEHDRPGYRENAGGDDHDGLGQ